MTVAATQNVFLDGGTDTFIEESAANVMRFAVGGQTGLTLTEQNTNVFPSFDVTTGITAFAGGGQASAVLVDSFINNITVVGTNSDSVKLPLASAGITIIINNDDAAQTLAVFPNTNDDCDGEADDAVCPVELAAGVFSIYVAVDADSWIVLT